MAPPSSTSVTVDESYFNTLLRKAQLASSSSSATPADSMNTVTIPRADYDTLLASSREYHNLRTSLHEGGITAETLAVLVSGRSDQANDLDSSTHSRTDASSDTTAGLPLPRRVLIPHDHSNDLEDEESNRRDSFRVNHYENNRSRHAVFSLENESFGDDSSGDDNDFSQHERGASLPRYDKRTRTINLTNLPQRTTHADVTAIIRGGVLLDVFLRPLDRTASVSFVEEDDADALFRHAKRNDLYIRGKRVDISWAERQYILSGHIANMVSMGATRNIILRSANPKHTEESVRDDLEHIHNLVIISVGFSGRDIRISTNSVRTSMFARTCMMSRVKYRGCRIEWDADECAASILTPTSQKFRNDNSAPRRASLPINRFSALDLDAA